MSWNQTTAAFQDVTAVKKTPNQTKQKNKPKNKTTRQNKTTKKPQQPTKKTRKPLLSFTLLGENEIKIVARHIQCSARPHIYPIYSSEGKNLHWLPVLLFHSFFHFQDSLNPYSILKRA